MSEFSESYHLRTTRREDAVELLRRAGLKGYVFPPSNGWVTFLAEGGVFEPDQRIVAANVNPLLHFVSAVDHCWSFALFKGTNVVSHYHCGWVGDIAVDDSGYTREPLLQVVPTAEARLFDEFEEHLHPQEFEELFDPDPCTLFAQALGLEHYECLSFDYMVRYLEDSPDIHPDITEFD